LFIQELLFWEYFGEFLFWRIFYFLYSGLFLQDSKELNVKAYVMILKKEEALNQWLDKQLKAGLIVELKSQYTAPCFYIPKKDGSL